MSRDTEDIILEVSKFSLLELPTKKELIFPWLKEDSINLISGWRGMGKTWLALSLLDAVSDEKNFGPWECKNTVPVLFLDGEMTTSDIRERVYDLNLNSDRKNPFYIYSDAYANSLGVPRAHLEDEEWRTEMKTILLARKVKLWVIDNTSILTDCQMQLDSSKISIFKGMEAISSHHLPRVQMAGPMPRLKDRALMRSPLPPCSMFYLLY